MSKKDQIDEPKEASGQHILEPAGRAQRSIEIVHDFPPIVLDGAVGLWDAESAKGWAALDGQPAGVYSVAWNPSGKTLVSGSSDKTVRIGDITTTPPLQSARLADVNRTSERPEKTVCHGLRFGGSIRRFFRDARS